jgi:hypothetical protein
MTAPADDHYWSVDIHGLTEGEAKQVVEWVEANKLGWFGSAEALDPRMSLTLHLDRDSVQMLYDGVMSNPETATPEHGLAGALAEWLDWSSRSP